jgi:hypothetical protein
LSQNSGERGERRNSKGTSEGSRNSKLRKITIHSSDEMSSDRSKVAILNSAKDSSIGKFGVMKLEKKPSVLRRVDFLTGMEHLQKKPKTSGKHPNSSNFKDENLRTIHERQNSLSTFE